MTRQTSVNIAALLVLAMVVFGISLATPARADPTTDTGSEAFWSRQQILLDVIQDIGSTYDNDPNYIAPEVDVDTGVVTVWWYGVAPLDELQSIAGNRAKVAAHSYPYNRATMETAVASIWGVSSEALAKFGFKIGGIAGVTAEGAVVVEGNSVTASADAKDPGLASLIRGAVASGVTGRSMDTIPTVDIRGGVTTSAASSRGLDTSPFNAGSYFITASGQSCNSAFGVTWHGYARSMTARHCNTAAFRPRDSADVSANYTFYGAAYTDSGTATRLTVSAGWNRAFVGGYTSTTYQSVKSVVNVGLNAYVCTSGGNSGEHCGVKITNMWYSWHDGFGTVWTIQGQQTTSGAIAVIQGDSGGPVITHYSSTTIGAVGVIQALQNGRTTNCGLVHDGGNNLCSPTVMFTSVKSTLTNTGATLNIGP